ncbi:MAG: hypothetical protein KAS72_04735 [Phycisphaerales bacterium]|nr:hypothetical protein [Phycisphaerales bacterium]
MRRLRAVMRRPETPTPGRRYPGRACCAAGRYRAMTLLELLVALTLLSGVTLAATTWTTFSLRSGAEIGRRVRWEQGAAAVLELIHDDVAAGDLLMTDRISVQRRVLLLHTRAGAGTTVRCYELHHGCLILTERSPTGARLRRSIILGDVDSFAVELNERAGVLIVRIGGVSEMTRRFITR